MAIRTQVEKVTIVDRGRGELPGARAPEFPGSVPTLAPELDAAPKVEAKSTTEVVAEGRAEFDEFAADAAAKRVAKK